MQHCAWYLLFSGVELNTSLISIITKNVILSLTFYNFKGKKYIASETYLSLVIFGNYYDWSKLPKLLKVRDAPWAQQGAL